MKLNYLIIITAFSFLTANAQTEEIVINKFSTFSIRLGAGIPQGDFADDDPTNFRAGLAETGVFFEANLNHFLNDVAYIILAGKYQSNGFDTDPLSANIRGQVPSQVNVNVRSEPWINRSLMGGMGLFSKSKTGGSTLYSRILFGFSVVSSPELNIELDDNITRVTTVQASESVTALSFQVGGGLGFNINQNTELLINADYYTANPSFDDVTSVTSDGVSSDTQTFTFDQPISIWAISLGLSFQL